MGSDVSLPKRRVKSFKFCGKNTQVTVAKAANVKVGQAHFHRKRPLDGAKNGLAGLKLN
jgi:hypothetical protein